MHRARTGQSPAEPRISCKFPKRTGGFQGQRDAVITDPHATLFRVAKGYRVNWFLSLVRAGLQCVMRRHDRGHARESCMIDFKGQVAVVTGAGRGLGRLYALEMARRGAAVVVNDLGSSSRGEGADASVAEQTAKEIVDAGGKAVASHDSVGTPEGGESIIRAAIENFGRVDVVINNAGIFEFTPFEDLTPASWRKMLNVHVDGSFHVSQPAFRAMKAQGYGRFVFISSSAGMFGNPGNAHYGTAKAALVGLSNVLAIEGAAHGILANSVLPTGFSRMVTDSSGQKPDQTEPPPGFKEFREAIDPDLVMPLVVFLASRACTLTHQNFACCAGRYSRVFVGLAKGWLADAGTKPSIDDVAAHMAEIRSTEEFSVPAALFDEIRETCAMRGITLGGRG
jgi:NAD(P)-dependent dehydrogenase (short-subunit alcohol dehydrogenase family)